MVEVKKQGISLQRIESRPSITQDGQYDFFIEFSSTPQVIEAFVKDVEKIVQSIVVLNSTNATGFLFFLKRE